VAGGGVLDFVQLDAGIGTLALTDVLVAGGDLKYRNGLVHGNAVYGGNLQLKNVTFENGGAPRLDSVIDFAAATQALNDICGLLTTSPPTGSVTVDAAGIELTGVDPDSNIFHVGVNDVNSALSIFVSVPSGATALIVVDGTAQVTMRKTTFVVGSTQPQKILWTFCGTSRVTFDKLDFMGSTVAPAAELRFGDTTITGTAAAAVIDGQGVTYTAPFTGCIKPDTGSPGEEPPPCDPSGNGHGKKGCK